MALIHNPEVKKLVNNQGFDSSSALRSLGLLAPGGDVARLPGEGTSNISYRIGEGLGSLAENPRNFAPVGKVLSTLANNSGGSALAGAILGGLGGAGFAAGTRRDPLLWALLGAGTTGAAGYGLSRLIQSNARRRQIRDQEMSKAAFYVDNEQDPMSFIQTKLFEDGSIGSSEKAQMVAQLRNIPSNQLFTLADMLRTAGGGAIGYIIGKFLMRFGGMGTSIMTGLGALLGSQSGRPGPRRNMLGLEVDPSRDFFGRPRLLF